MIGIAMDLRERSGRPALPRREPPTSGQVVSPRSETEGAGDGASSARPDGTRCAARRTTTARMGGWRGAQASSGRARPAPPARSRGCAGPPLSAGQPAAAARSSGADLCPAHGGVQQADQPRPDRAGGTPLRTVAPLRQERRRRRRGRPSGASCRLRVRLVASPMGRRRAVGPGRSGSAPPWRSLPACAGRRPRLARLAGRRSGRRASAGRSTSTTWLACSKAANRGHKPIAAT